MSRRPLLLLCLLALWLALPLRAAENHYQAWVQDIQQRLDQALASYAQGDSQTARKTVQLAYFEVFENLEGPIRINLSAQRSYEMESQFTALRQLMGSDTPLPQVQQQVAAFKQELTDVLPQLEGGHTLTAQQSHDGYDAKVAPYWQQQFQITDDTLAQALQLYQQGDFAQASATVQQAQYRGFKNSELETQLRLSVSAKAAADINAQFSRLISLAGQPDQLNELAYQVTTLLQDLGDQLPNLPLPADQQAPAEQQASAAAPQQDWAQVRQQIDQAVTAALAQYQDGKPDEAILAVQDAYFDLFEASGMENRLGAADSAFKAQVEGHFTRLVSQMKAGQPQSALQQTQAALLADLQLGVDRLQQGSSSHWGLFITSLLILLREGLEALLIVAAIIAYLIKNDQADKLPVIRQSVWMALLASLVTAALFQWLFAGSGASRELLEGITMLIAVVMLFGMSYWLLSKVEAAHWKAYLQGRINHSLDKGSLWGLWLTSFLAVYREGAETVLFYYALLAEAKEPVAVSAVLVGMLVGAVALAIIYLLMRYSVVRLPLKPFFIFTGSFMYLMAFVFAGKGVLELIEGKLFQPSLLPGVPELSWLGIYPYAETLLPQAILLLAALFALWRLKQTRALVAA